MRGRNEGNGDEDGAKGRVEGVQTEGHLFSNRSVLKVCKRGMKDTYLRHIFLRTVAHTPI